MDAPGAPDAAAFAAERARLLGSARPIDPAETVFGQYEGYRDVEHVAPDSSVPTFVAFRLWIDTPRWQDVPFLVRTGKAMATTETTATVVFRGAPALPFAAEDTPPDQDRLTFRIGPDHGVDLSLQTKVPGDGMTSRPTTLAVDYDAVFGRIPRAYERIFAEALQGDRTQFSDEAVVEEAWRVVDGITDPDSDPETYARGTWGPASAGHLPGDGRDWVQPA
jgi:glucose-6-phosphate 1-dehydrogenase